MRGCAGAQQGARQAPAVQLDMWAVQEAKWPCHCWIGCPDAPDAVSAAYRLAERVLRKLEVASKVNSSRGPKPNRPASQHPRVGAHPSVTAIRAGYIMHETQKPCAAIIYGTCITCAGEPFLLLRPGRLLGIAVHLQVCCLMRLHNGCHRPLQGFSPTRNISYR